MADYTTTQAGNYSSGSTWVGGVAPPSNGSGVRSVLISHAVTIDASCTIGGGGPGPSVGSAMKPTGASVAGGGSLATATYRFCYTNVDASGNESGPSPEGTQAITVGATLRLTLPALPAGVTTRNIYLTTSGTKLANKRYKTGTTGTTVDCVDALWEDNTVTEANAARLPFALRANAALTIADGVTLTMNGDIALNDVALTIGHGVAILFNAPSGQSYRLWSQIIYGGTGGDITFNGTSGAHDSITAASGATWAMESFYDSAAGYAANNGNISWTYLDVDKAGGASQPWLRWMTFANKVITLTNVTVADNCGILIAGTSLAAGAGWNFTDCLFGEGADTGNNALGSNHLNVKLGGSSVPTATRSMVRCTFKGGMQCQPGGATFRDCFCPEGIQDPGGGSVAAAEITRCFYWFGGHGSSAINGIPCIVPMTDCVVVGDSSYVNGNFHILLPRVTGNVSGVIWDCNCVVGEDSSDLLYSQSSCTITITNNIVCWNDVAQLGAGVLNPNHPCIMKVRHNSAHGCATFCYVGDLTLVAGTVTEYKSNLVIGPTSGSLRFHVAYVHNQTDPSASGVPNVLTGSGVVKNAGYRLDAGQEGGGFNTYNTDATIGADTIMADPNCVDNLRNLGRWAVARGYSSSAYGTEAQIRTAYADGIAALKADFVTRMADYRSWVSAGWAPRNTLLKNAGDDGVTIGAVEGSFGGSPGLLLVGVG